MFQYARQPLVGRVVATKTVGGKTQRHEKGHPVGIAAVVVANVTAIFLLLRSRLETTTVSLDGQRRGAVDASDNVGHIAKKDCWRWELLQAQTAVVKVVAKSAAVPVSIMPYTHTHTLARGESL